MGEHRVWSLDALGVGSYVSREHVTKTSCGEAMSRGGQEQQQQRDETLRLPGCTGVRATHHF